MPKIKSKAKKSPKKKPAPLPVWSYSFYRATLRKDGKPFAVVTPDGRNALSHGAAAELLAALNGDALVEVLAGKMNAAASSKDFRPFFMDIDRRNARALLGL